MGGSNDTGETSTVALGAGLSPLLSKPTLGNDTKGSRRRRQEPRKNAILSSSIPRTYNQVTYRESPPLAVDFDLLA